MTIAHIGRFVCGKNERAILALTMKKNPYSLVVLTGLLPAIINPVHAGGPHGINTGWVIDNNGNPRLPDQRICGSPNSSLIFATSSSGTNGLVR